MRFRSIRRGGITCIVLLALGAGGATGAGCSNARSRCEKICAREQECAERLGRNGARFDEGECVEQCSQLERLPKAVPALEAHARCVADAPGCAQVLECP